MKLNQGICGTESSGLEPNLAVVSSLLTDSEGPAWVEPPGLECRLVAGPRFDGEAARKAGREDAACVTAVAVEGWGRFGNSVLQTANALAVAVHHRLKSVYLPGWWWLRGGRYEVAGGLRVVNRRGVALDDEEIIAVGRFFDLGPASGVATGCVSPAEALGWLREWLVVRPAGRALPDDHLVIHLRAGDVFGAGAVHPEYGQPPLGFYRKVLEEGGAWREFTVVAEDGRNPVMEPLAALCRAHGGVHLRVGRPLAEDLELLLRARALVVGKGTFAMAVAALSEHLDGVHSFEHGFSPWGNGRVRVTEWGDERGDYRRAVLAGNWRNTAAQRELMLHYPMAAIRATGEHPAPEQPQPSPDCLSAYRMVHPCSRP